MPSYCLVPTCTASSKTQNSKRIFHVLPQDDDLLCKWLEAMGLNSYENNLMKRRASYRVCSDHFDDASYEMKRVLRKTAIPTLELYKSGESATSNRSNATNAQVNSEAKSEHPLEVSSDPDNKPFKADNTIEIDEHTLRVEINRRLEMEASILAAGPRDSEEFLKYSRNFLSPKTLKLLTCQLLMKEDDKRKFPLKHKLICLDLYYHNPRAYGFLQEFMSLPPIGSLRNLYLNLQSEFISYRCMRLLKSMLSKMNVKDKCCVVGMASTAIKKHVYYDITNDKLHGMHRVDQKHWGNPTKKAYALVVRGLRSSWRMPVSFIFLHDSDVDALHHWSGSVVQSLIREGLDICAFISNQSDTDSKLLAELRMNSFILRNKTIKNFNIFDVRFLLQSLRDCLMRFDMAIASEGLVSWKHILTFYNIETEMQTNIAPGLTLDHVNPGENRGSSPEHAVLVFSKPVVTAMRAFIKLKLLDESAVATVNFMNRISELFDLLNSDTLKHDSPTKRAFTGEKSQEKILKEMRVYLDRPRRVFNGVLHRIEPIEGLMVTVKSVLRLWKNLRKKGGTHLLTRSLNLEFVEECFREIDAHAKKQKKKCVPVTTIEFIRGFNKCFLNNFIKNARLNSSKSLKSSLSKLHEYLVDKTEQKDKMLDLEVKNKAFLVDDDVDHKISLPKQKVLRYIAGYLMTKALEKHNSCGNLMKYLCPSETMTNTFIDCEYLGVKLPVSFVLFVVKMEHEFIKVFEQDLMPQEVAAQAMKAMNSLVILPCRCFPLFLVKKLFIRIRIYNTVKDINRQLKTKDVFIINTYDL